VPWEKESLIMQIKRLSLVLILGLCLTAPAALADDGNGPAGWVCELWNDVVDVMATLGLAPAPAEGTKAEADPSEPEAPGQNDGDPSPGEGPRVVPFPDPSG